MTMVPLAHRCLLWCLVGLVGVAARADEPGATLPAERLAGRVVDHVGQPIAEVHVFAAFDSEADLEDPTEDDFPHAVTDPTGQFQVTWSDRATGRGARSVWVYRPGFRLARIVAPIRANVRPVAIELEPVVGPAGASLQVLSPRGEPVPRARVVPTRWFDGGLGEVSPRTWPIPGPVGELIAGQTDDDGQVVIESVAALRLASVAVLSARWGGQIAAWEDSLSARHRQVWLRAVGRVAGQVRSDDPVAGLTVRIMTLVGNQPVGLRTTVTDGTGKFAFGEVVAGEVEVAVVPRPESAELPDQVMRRTLGADAEITTDLVLNRPVAVTGVVRERGRPGGIPGVWLAFPTPGNLVHRVRTDDQGRFSVLARADVIHAVVEAAPAPFIVPHSEPKPIRIEVIRRDGRFESSPIELERGRLLRGQVVDQAQRPIAEPVTVEARYSDRDGRAWHERIVATVTADGGRFEVGPVPPVDLAVFVRRAGIPGDALARVAAADIDQPLGLTLPEPSELLAPTGRVVDALGRPVAHALVQFRLMELAAPSQTPPPQRRITGDGLDVIVTDEQGRYEGARRLDPRQRYLVSAEAVDCEAGRTRPIAPRSTGAGQLRFPDLVLRRYPARSVVVGRVVGTDGGPIAGAMVRDLAKHQAVTDGSGWFRLERGSRSGPAFLFAQRAGYRFFGRSFAARPDQGDLGRPVTIRLTRTDEPATDRLRPPSMGMLASRALTRLLTRLMAVNPWVERTLARQDGVASSMVLEPLSRVQPTQVVAWLDQGVVADHRVSDGLRRVAAKWLAASNFEAAERTIQAIHDRDARGLALLEAIDHAGGLGPVRQRSLIERVERAARSIDDEYRRVVVLAAVAARWLDQGDPDQARRVLADARTVADRLPPATTGSRAWCALMPPLARLDPKVAHQHLRHLTDPADLDGCRLILAKQWARRDPGEAIRTLRRIRDQKLLVRSTPELCHLLAPVDLAQARTLAHSIQGAHPGESAYALGMMAASLARVDRPAATRLLREAFDQLEACVATAPDLELNPALIAATLLATVEVVDPDLIAESFWKCVAMHPAHPAANFRGTTLLALLLDRYDPDVARTILDPGRFDPAALVTVEVGPLLLATIQVAPELAGRWLRVRLDPARQFPPRPPAIKPTDYDLIAGLCSTDPDRWTEAARQLLHLWTPDRVSVKP